MSRILVFRIFLFWDRLLSLAKRYLRTALPCRLATRLCVGILFRCRRQGESLMERHFELQPQLGVTIQISGFRC